MKLFTSDQIRLWDQATIESHFKDSSELMEFAAEKLVEQLLILEDPDRVYVICGIGNNGGDGLCMARILASQSVEVSVVVVGDAQQGSKDFRMNLERVMEADLPLMFYGKDENHLVFEPDSIILDCILGSGTSRPADGLIATAINEINQNITCTKIAIDIPSGLLPDDFSGQEGFIIRADRTLTIEVPKRALLVSENTRYIGELTIVSIGLDHVFERSTDCEYSAYDMVEAVFDLEFRSLNVHKKTNGHVVLIAGSKGKMGACLLAARGAMRVGAGMLTARIPACGYSIVQTALPEVMCDVDEGVDYIKSAGELNGFESLALGPGLGKAPEVALMMRKVLKEIACPCVLDADALNLIAEKNLFNDIPQGSILTPHIGEFNRLFGETTSDKERLEVLRTKSRELGVVIVLKGPYTRVATPNGEISFNTTGNPILATAGSGDVLTGVIAGLLAQGYDPSSAARLGVFLHGLSGDVLSIQMGDSGALAGEIADGLPHAKRVVKAASDDPLYNPPAF
ncbi:MAG: NAD(P)H-hydrate dehydratase [Flavobacteriales bacterium]